MGCVPAAVPCRSLFHFYALRHLPLRGASGGTPALEAEIGRRIALGGLMLISEFMALCLLDPTHGYDNS